MKCLRFVVAAIVFSAAWAGQVLAQLTPAPVQTPAGVPVLGSVTQGNTTVVFEAANPSDIDSQTLRTWDSFAEDHEDIARALAFKPSLIDDERYLSRHPDLDHFLEEHPDVRAAMESDPGNFAAIPPRPGE